VKSKMPQIGGSGDKVAWFNEMERLRELRLNGTVRDVIAHLRAVQRPRLPDDVLRWKTVCLRSTRAEEKSNNRRHPLAGQSQGTKSRRRGESRDATNLSLPHSRGITPVFSFVWLHKIAPVTHQDQAQRHPLPHSPWRPKVRPRKTLVPSRVQTIQNDRPVAIGHPTPIPIWLTVRAIPCLLLGRRESASIQTSWFIAQSL
jgi:hypothetical protein